MIVKLIASLAADKREGSNCMGDRSADSLFGKAGPVFEKICVPILREFRTASYRLIAPDQFGKLPQKDMLRGYWTEILSRSHWAAISNLLRHQLWVDGCRSQFAKAPNYLGFCAALRGLVEAAADAVYSLRAVPLTLAKCNGPIRAALQGTLPNGLICSELENALIHFQFARKTAKREGPPDTHQAKKTTEYLRGADSQNDDLKSLYGELCEVVHPAAALLQWAASSDGERIHLSVADSHQQIVNLCQRHATAIEISLVESVNSSLLILGVLNTTARVRG
jgi:hypothetical protein